MTLVPQERRLPSLALAACVLSMPLMPWGLPWLVFDGLYAGTRPPIPVQYWTFAAVIVCQWIAFGCGLCCLRILRTPCPRPATVFGAWVTGVTGVTFIVCGTAWCGTAWCGTCAIVLAAMTAYPW